MQKWKSTGSTITTWKSNSKINDYTEKPRIYTEDATLSIKLVVIIISTNFTFPLTVFWGTYIIHISFKWHRSCVKMTPLDTIIRKTTNLYFSGLVISCWLNLTAWTTSLTARKKAFMCTPRNLPFMRYGMLELWQCACVHVQLKRSKLYRDQSKIEEVCWIGPLTR